MRTLSPLRHHPRTALALAGAALADAATMLMLPVGAELNPLAAHYPALAVVAKGCVAALLLIAPLGPYARRVQMFGVIAWSIGALSNVLVLWR